MPQPNHLRKFVAVAALGLVLNACAPAAPSAPPTVTVPPTAAPTLTPTVAPAADAAPTPLAVTTPDAATDVPVDWTTVATVDGDYYVLGNPAAPIRLIDYSDFL